MPKGHRGGGGLIGKTAANVGLSKLSDVAPYQVYSVTTTGSGTLSLSGNGTSSLTVVRTSGTGWDTQMYSTTSYTKPATIEFSKNASFTDDGLSYAMIGWNTDPTTDASYSSLDYAAYPYSQSIYSVYNNGANPSYGGTWSSGNKFYIVYSADGYIRHWNGARLLYTVSYGNNTVYLDTSIYSPSANSQLSNVRIINKEWNGFRYV